MLVRGHPDDSRPEFAIVDAFAGYGFKMANPDSSAPIDSIEFWVDPI